MLYVNMQKLYKMKKLFYLTFLFTVLFSSCSTSKDTVRYTVASQYGDCVGAGPQKCLFVKKDKQPDWQFFYSSIEGFNYEEGYEYVIDVKEEKRENVPADASSIKYILVKEISKTQKTSEGLPLNKQGSPQVNGQVISIESTSVGRGAAAGQFEVSVVKIKVTSSSDPEIKQGDIIYCELVSEPKVKPVEGREYVFKAKHKHPAHAKGVYLLETEVVDLI